MQRSLTTNENYIVILECQHDYSLSDNIKVTDLEKLIANL